MSDEHFLAAGDFHTGLGTAPFFGSGPYAPPPPPGFDVAACAAAMAPFGMLPWASEFQLPAESAATTAHFDSALSSLVSSPAHASGGCGDDVAIGDLIGRLGSICNTAASANNSCYSTPLSSPPRGASPAALAFRGGYYPGAAPLETGGRLSRAASSKSLGAAAPALESPAEAETKPTAAGKTEMPAKAGAGSGAARKRKASGKCKTGAATNGSPKRSKVACDGDDNGNEDAAAAYDDAKEPEPVKDYIHVRARRGQATDSHSLAERVRREKISERMKLLESLVPGCNKITGKALMLDEIINYVQSLQRQVEFLSMKLSTMNPELDVDAPHQYHLPSDDKDMMVHHQTAMLGYSHQDAAFSYGDPFAGAAMHPTTMESCITSNSFHPAGAGGFGGWEAAAAQDLQSVVHRHPHDGFHGGQHHQQEEATTVSHMKVEP